MALSTDLHRIFDFIIELDKLKAVLRKTKPVELDRYENSAEHSWQVALLAILLAKEAVPAIDVTRVVEMLLVHDIPEIDTDDRIVYQGRDEQARLAEYAAAERIFGLLPEAQAKWCQDLWAEYDARLTNEAKFAYAIDRLMPLLHNLRNHGQSWVENHVPLDRIFQVNAAIGHSLPSVWPYVQSLIHEFATTTSLISTHSRTGITSSQQV